MSAPVLLAAIAFLVSASPVFAVDDVVGRWVLDEAAFRAQAERFYGDALLQVPAERQAEASALAARAVDAAVAQLRGSAVTFAADGSVVLESASGGPQAGTWTRDGDVVRLEPVSDAPEVIPLVGRLLADGALRLTPDQPGGVGFVMRRVPGD